MAKKHIVYKLGKLPARKDAFLLKFTDYFNIEALPKPPVTFGRYDKFFGWGMYQNDRVGDCVLAGGANETANWSDEGGAKVIFTDDNVISDYSAITGFDPNAQKDDRGENTTDTGTDVGQAAKYRQKTGLIDSAGTRHKIDAYVGLEAGNYDYLKVAMYLFGGVGIGIRFPASAMKQFNAGQPWDVVEGSRIRGGHYIPGFGIDPAGNIVIVTWGQTQKMTRAFFEKYCDEVVVYLSVERFKNKISPEAFNYDALMADLTNLTNMTSIVEEEIASAKNVKPVI